jgi:hypothetical protein
VIRLSATLDLYEKSHIERSLDKAGGDKSRAAELMGLSLSTLYRKLEKLGIEVSIPTYRFPPDFHLRQSSTSSRSFNRRASTSATLQFFRRF